MKEFQHVIRSFIHEIIYDTSIRWRAISRLTASFPWMLATYLTSGLPFMCWNGEIETTQTHRSRPVVGIITRYHKIKTFFSFISSLLFDTVIKKTGRRWVFQRKVREPEKRCCRALGNTNSNGSSSPVCRTRGTTYSAIRAWKKKRFQPQITARESQYLLLQHCQRGVMCTVISQLFMYTLNGFADRVKGR